VDVADALWRQLDVCERERILAVNLGEPPAEGRLLDFFKSLGSASFQTWVAALQHERSKVAAGLDDCKLQARTSPAGDLSWQLCARSPLLGSDGLEIIRKRGAAILGSKRLRAARSLQGLLVKAERTWACVGALVYLAFELRWCAYVEMGSSRSGEPVPTAPHSESPHAKARTSPSSSPQKSRHPKPPRQAANPSQPSAVPCDTTHLRAGNDSAAPPSALHAERASAPAGDRGAPPLSPARVQIETCICGNELQAAPEVVLLGDKRTFLDVGVRPVGPPRRKRAASFPGDLSNENDLRCGTCGHAF
jgi:hypothetical protein